MLMTTVVAAALMIWTSGAPCPSLWLPTAICAALYSVSYCWQPNLLRGLATLVAFSASFTILMEAIAATGRPLADQSLLAADAALGLSAPATVALIDQYSPLSLLLKAAYFSVMPQTCVAMLMLAEKPALWVFLRRFMLAALITVCCFYFFPAEGVATSISPPVAARFFALRAGAAIDWQQAQGIITFPSFHTAWALLLMASFWDTRLRWPAVALNALTIASTVTTGGHYYVDIPAGALVGLAAIMQPFTVKHPVGWSIDLPCLWRRRRSAVTSPG